MAIILFIIGFVILIKGADIMVDGSSSIARKFNISPFVIGLTIVAFGTSSPELVVSLLASIKGSADIALGNVIGSNISNTLLILGATSLVLPLVVKKATLNKEIPFSLLATTVVGILVNDSLLDGDKINSLTRIDGLVLVLFFVIFIYYTFGIMKTKENVMQKAISEIRGDEPKEYPVFYSIMMIVLGLIGLSLGGKWIVDGAIYFASYLGVGEAFIGLTIVAIGTSLPELAASMMAAYKGNTDIAIGNVIGSNIFNMFWVLGVGSIVNNIAYDTMLNVDILILISITVLLLFLIFLGKRNILEKREGIVLLVLYVGYMAFLVYRG